MGNSWLTSLVLTELSTWLYLAISLCRVRSRIMATIPDRNNTITREFIMLQHNYHNIHVYSKLYINVSFITFKYVLIRAHRINWYQFYWEWWKQYVLSFAMHYCMSVRWIPGFRLTQTAGCFSVAQTTTARCFNMVYSWNTWCLCEVLIPSFYIIWTTGCLCEVWPRFSLTWTTGCLCEVWPRFSLTWTTGCLCEVWPKFSLTWTTGCLCAAWIPECNPILMTI